MGRIFSVLEDFLNLQDGPEAYTSAHQKARKSAWQQGDLDANPRTTY
jgi:hypothetical protein